jgi:thioredoxin-related protein
MRLLVMSFVATVFCVGLPGSVFGDEPKGPPTTMPVYDESANAAQDIDAAVRRAGFENHRVLLDIGGNWCHWCTLLHNLFEQNQDIKTLLRSEYQVVNVDIGQGEKNKELLSGYGINADSFPYFAILSPNNKLVVQQETGALEDGPRHDPQKVLAFLNRWKASPLDAQKVLSDALTEAGTHGKRVFLHVGAPWCGWCHKLEDVLYQPAVTEAICSEFVMTKIDTERMVGAADVLKKYQTSGGIPWYAIVAPDGTVVSTSDLTPGNNIGFPTEPAEIDHVMHMLTDGRKHMTDDQIAVLRDAFTKAAAAVNASAH